MVEQVAEIQTQALQMNAESVERTISSQPVGDMHFNGTIGDLQTKYPELYNKLVLQQIAYHIVNECRRNNEHFLEEMKKHRDG